MIALLFPRGAAVILCLVLLFPAYGEESSESPGQNPQMIEWLVEANSLASRNLPVQAAAKCNEVIAAFESHYKDSAEKVFCARTREESLLYLMGAATGGGKAIVIPSTWADAYFIKAYALQEMQRVPEAMENIQRALVLSPSNSQYLCEQGSLFQLEKKWTEAKAVFKKAEDSAELAPKNMIEVERGRAKRGYAYCLIEEGDLDGAEKIYLECLKTNPDDARAKNELEYIRQLRAKEKKT